MIYTYASSYISGFGKIVEAILKSKIKDIVIVKNLDGLIIYQTKLQFSELKLSCFNNTYQVLAITKSITTLSYENALKKFISQIELNLTGISNNINLMKSKSFKILPFDENSPTSINFDTIKNLEQRIARNLDLQIGLKKHNFDIILSRRREGLFLLLFKLTYNRLTEKKLAPGSLRPELCNIMAWIANLNPTDIIIDPFCGHGSIPKEIVKHFRYNMLFASDTDETLINNLKTEFKKNNKNFFIKQRDALNLDYFQDGFFDKIITDPPWNSFNSKEQDFSVFYNKMLSEFSRILKQNGICIILMGNIKEFDVALGASDFKLLEKHHILVNGKKANLYKLTKI